MPVLLSRTLGGDDNNARRNGLEGQSIVDTNHGSAFFASADVLSDIGFEGEVPPT
ncbi:hypothetical protein HMPREF9622_01942 [Cutibacterium modestum HL037PA3]|uniref:Uncharacterized protein n=1 Tax=Cutibacterium modestum HL044PA1 TaxID=765109 RepID=A0ABN0C6X5_9ACTN|nr:hypothetical protein HMPREF9607_00854 [Cutibacterium modestum HL044PA1]EFT14975.1 hypothetical protein HMPREF9622_01942 [Cutibacterium modestum HL037PA3]